MARLEAIAAREGATDAGDAARLLLARLIDGPDAAETGADTRRAALIEAVLARDPANAEALALRAEIALRADRPAAAIEDLRAALAQTPRDPDLLELLAVAHERDGDAALAAERRALAVQASDFAPGPSLRHAAHLAREGKSAAAESVLLDALSRARDDRDLLTALAELRLQRRDWEGARQVIAAAEALGSEDGGGTLDRMRAAALLGEGRVDETLALLEQGWRDRGAGSDMAALVRGYAAAGELGRAEAFLGDVLAGAPGDTRAMALMAEVKAAAGDAAGAEATLRRALAAAPEIPDLHRLLAGLLFGVGRTAEADAALEAGLAAAPRDRRLRFDLALRREAQGDPEAAIAIYEGLYAEDPDDALVANNLASLLSDHRADADSLARAAAVARRLRASPSPAFQDTYGWTLHLAGDSAQAVAVLRESAPQLADNPIAQHHLAVAYAAIGQDALAREQFARALALAEAGAFFPQRAQAEAELARLEASETQAQGSNL
jgi:cellulose synthase operon protein C